MANTVTSLSYANTFGDWVVTTNALVRENNNLASNNYFKNSGTLYLNSGSLGLQVANNAVVAGQLAVTGLGSSVYIQNGLTVGGPTNMSGQLTVANNAVFSGQVSVGGNFVITGTTVYSTNTFTLNANSGVGQTSSLSVNRGSSGANASIRWNEANTYWDILDTASLQYYRIITTGQVTDSLSTASSVIAASANAAATLYSYTTNSNTAMKSYVDNGTATLNAAIISANSSLKAYVDSNVATLNATIISANTSMKSYVDNSVAYPNGVNNYQNNVITAVNAFAQAAYNQANTTSQNSISYITGVDVSQNAAITAVNQFAQGAYNQANSVVLSVTGTSNQIITSSATGAVTLSTPQAIGTGSSVQFGSFGVGTGASGTSGEIRATNNITAYYSDDRLKTRLGNIQNALDKVMSLNGFQYEANEVAQALGYAVKPEVGLSAQEVQAVLPEVVVPAPIDEKYLTIHYERVIPLLVEAIKELKAEIDNLKSNK
jgi:hypothetical protein